ncbi:hypothetical protein Tco_0255888, partial [Tanacetum coccineum]
PFTISFLESRLMVLKLRWERQRCHNHACVDEALAMKQISVGEDDSCNAIL